MKTHTILLIFVLLSNRLNARAELIGNRSEDGQAVASLIHNQYPGLPKDKQQSLIDILNNIDLKPAERATFVKDLKEALLLAMPNFEGLAQEPLLFDLESELIKWFVTDHNARKEPAADEEHLRREQLAKLVAGLQAISKSSPDLDANLGRTLEAKIESMSSNPFLPCLKKPLTDEEIDKNVTFFSKMVTAVTQEPEWARKGMPESYKFELKGLERFPIMLLGSRTGALTVPSSRYYEAQKKQAEDVNRRFDQIHKKQMEEMHQKLLDDTMAAELANVEQLTFVISPVFYLKAALEGGGPVFPPAIDMKGGDVLSLPADLRETLVKICGKTPEFKSLECDAIVDVVVPPFVPPADVPNGINLKMAYKIQRPDQMLAKIISRNGLGMGHYYFKRVVADYFQDRTGTTYIISGDKLVTKGPSGGWSQTTFPSQVETNALTADITSTGLLPDIQRYLNSWSLLSDPSTCRVQLEKQAEGRVGQGQTYKLVFECKQACKPFEPHSFKRFSLLVDTHNGLLRKEALDGENQVVATSTYTDSLFETGEAASRPRRVEGETSISAGSVAVVQSGLKVQGQAEPTPFSYAGNATKPGRIVKEVYQEEHGVLLPKTMELWDKKDGYRIMRIEFANYKLGAEIPPDTFLPAESNDQKE